MTSPARVLAILNLFSAQRPIWHTDEINDAMGYTRATGYRYVKDLVEAGFLQKVSGGRYSLGARIIELDYQLRRSDPVLLAAVPVMDELVRKARLDAVLTTMFGDRIIDVYRASADATLQLGYGRGRPRPLFKGAAPKVILSCTPRPQLVKIYEANAAEAGRHGLGTTWAQFRSYLADVRKQGFYGSMGELEPGVGGAAVPLLNEDGEALAALALVGTSAALLSVGEARMKTLLLRARDEIHARLASGVSPPAAGVEPAPKAAGVRRA
jgi:DNA-binding IclR family transcriptional regulator